MSDTWRRCLIPLFCTLALSFAANADGDSKEKKRPYTKSYQFGEDWFSHNIPIWEKHLAEFKGRPDVHYLEVGPYEGRSFFWTVDNILTHSTSKATGVDIFETIHSSTYTIDYEKVFRKNLKRSGRADDITTIKGYSQVELRNLPIDHYDIVYIDGSHDPADVLSDLVLAWELLTEGGIMILDDYHWHLDWPFDQRPFFAINAFISLYGKESEILRRADQVFLRKRADRCLAVHYEGCSYFGNYFYDWNGDRALIRDETGEKVPVSPMEKKLIEKIIRTKLLGNRGLVMTHELRMDPDFITLDGRLDLGL